MILAFFYFKKSNFKTVYVLSLLAMILALGQFSPIYVFFVKVFKFYSFRTPVKFIYFGGFFFCVLAALGFSKVFFKPDVQKVSKSFIVYASLLFLSLVAVLLTCLSLHLFEKQFMALGEFMLQKFVYDQPGHNHSWEHYLDKLTNVIRGARKNMSPTSIVVWMQAIKIGLSVVLIRIFIKRRIKETFFLIAALGILIFDLNFTYSDIRGDYASYEEFYKKSPVTTYLEANLGDDRYFNYSTNPAEAPLPAGKNMLYDLSTANAYSPLVAKDYYDAFGFMGGGMTPAGYHAVDDQYLYRNLHMLGLMNVKYLVSDRSLNHRYLAEKFSDKGWSIYENALVLEKYFLVSKVELLHSQASIMSAMREEEIRFDKIVFVEETPHYHGQKELEQLETSLSVLDDRQGFKKIDVRVASDSILVISEFYDWGWEVFVDGEKASIIRANAIIMGVPLSQGRREVILTYNPLRKVLRK